MVRVEECESDLFEELVDEFNRLSLVTFCQPRKPAKVYYTGAAGGGEYKLVGRFRS